MIDWLSFIVLAIFAVVFIALISAKLYSPFWFHQPVYHIYEIYPRIRWSRSPYIKKTRPPKRGIFCTPNNILTYSFAEIEDDNRIKLFVDLLQGHYLDNDTNLYHHTEHSLRKVLTNSKDVCVSGYYETELTEPNFHKKLNTTIVYGMITSRPVELCFLKFPEQNITVHYFDYICVHGKYRNNQQQHIVSRNLMQTHVYNHYLTADKSFSGVYLFKKEINMCKGIVPLLQTTAYTFILRKTALNRLPANYSVKCLNNKTSVDVWRVLYAQINQQFEICSMPSFPMTVEWLTNERYMVYISVYRENKQEKIHGLYVFEDTQVSYETEMVVNNPNMLRLAASMVFGQDVKKKDLYFFRGFVHSLKAVVRDRTKYGVLEIPNISDNGYILERWREKYELRNETKIGYYLYNMVYPNMPIRSDQFFSL
jgi:hypothetical protein